MLGYSYTSFFSASLSAAVSHVERKLHRAVVAAKNLVVYHSPGKLVVEQLRRQEIINAPAGIIVAGVESITPPRINIGLIRIEITEGIGEAAI